MFTDDFSRKYLDATEADGIRALRPGGPLDTISVTLKCTRCSQEKSEALRWFHLNGYTCDCGGRLDDKPLRERLAKLATEYFLKTRSPEEIAEFLKDGQRDDQGAS